MVSFTSKRERRLWTWALATLLAIYASAVFAGSLVEGISSDALTGIAFAAGLGLAIAAVAGLALTKRPRAEIWVAVAITAVYLLSLIHI